MFSSAVGDVADLVDGDRAKDEGDVVGAVFEQGEGVVDALRVVDAAPGGDVVFAHPGDTLEHQRLEDRRVEAAVGLGLALEEAVELGGVLQPQAEGLLVVGVVEAEDADAVLAERVDRSASTSLDLEQLAQALAEAALALGVVGEAGEQAVGGEDGEAGVVEPGQRHQRVVVVALAADLVAVGDRGLVAVVAVGDQQLRRRRAAR